MKTSQAQMARELGISKSYLSMILSGQRPCPPELAPHVESVHKRSQTGSGFEARLSLRGRCPRPLDECAALAYVNKKLEKFTASEAKSSQTLTASLLEKFILSRPSGTTQKSIDSYHYTLDSFVGYPITPEGISRYLASLKCLNGKAKFYSCLRALSRWLYRNGHIPENVIEKVPPPKTQSRLLPAVSHEQLDALMAHCHCTRDKALINFLWYSGTRLSEAVNTKASDFNWEEGTVIVLGKGNKYRKALAGNGIVREWFTEHDSFGIDKGGVQTMLKRLTAATGIQCNAHAFRRGFCVHQVKSGLSTRVVQALGGWEQISMVEKYSKSLGFEEALSLYKRVNHAS